MLNPEDIDKVSFTVRHLKGYDPQEVDDFLDKVRADYASALESLSRLRSTPTSVLPQAAPAVDPIRDVSRLLDVAQKAADQQVAEAKTAADSHLAEVKTAAEKVLADARAQAGKIVAEGNSRRHEIVGELELKRTELQNKVDALRTSHADTVAKLKAALQTLGESA